MNIEKKVGKAVDDLLLKRIVRPELLEGMKARGIDKAGAPRPAAAGKAEAAPRKGEAAGPASQADAAKSKPTPRPTPAPEAGKWPAEKFAFIWRPREIHSIQARATRAEVIASSRPGEVSGVTAVVIVGSTWRC